MAKAIRLDKFLADAGAGTRSEVKKYIQKGQVQVNGTVVKRPEEKIQPTEDAILLAGEPVLAAPEFVYYLLHKPAGYVSATEDNRDHTVMELIPSDRKGLFPVGRLDKDTEGLLLITDDGVLAHELLSPKKHVEKTYYAQVDGIVTPDDVIKFQEGLDIGEKNLTLPARLQILSAESSGDSEAVGSAGKSEILLTIHEGKFHQVKRMVEAVGKKVTYLKRISMGPLTLPEDLEKGQCRELTPEELAALKNN
jgi:16S rRNA pseudouridine516 synthase